MTKIELEKRFSNLVSEKNLTHAYLIESNNQTVLDELSLSIPKIIFCENANACDECKTCKLINENSFFQLITIGDGISKIKKLEILDLIFRINTSNISNDQRKVYVIKNAENLGNESGNSILKTLEEPPFGVTAILLSQSRHEVLSTIKSRCKLFFVDEEFVPLEQNDLADVIIEKNKEKLFLVSSKISKMQKSDALNILNDTLQKVILKNYLNLASDFYDTIYNVKKANNFSLNIENLFIKIFEVI
jgi:DNA polymerase-3 subunit delta'